MANLKLINNIYLALGLYALTHSIIAYWWSNNYDGVCNWITGVRWVDAYFWLANYLVNMVLWQYPIFYVFWPKKQKTERESEEYYQVRAETYSVSTLREDSSVRFGSTYKNLKDN